MQAFVYRAVEWQRQRRAKVEAKRLLEAAEVLGISIDEAAAGWPVAWVWRRSMRPSLRCATSVGCAIWRSGRSGCVTGGWRSTQRALSVQNRGSTATTHDRWRTHMFASSDHVM